MTTKKFINQHQSVENAKRIIFAKENSTLSFILCFLSFLLFIKIGFKFSKLTFMMTSFWKQTPRIIVSDKSILWSRCAKKSLVAINALNFHTSLSEFHSQINVSDNKNFTFRSSQIWYQSFAPDSLSERKMTHMTFYLVKILFLLTNRLKIIFSTETWFKFFPWFSSLKLCRMLKILASGRI